MRRSLFTRFAFACLWVFVFSIPIEKALEVPGLGSISKLAGFLALGAGAIAVAVQARFRIPGPIQVGLAFFILWSSLTLRWSIAPDMTIERITTYLQLLGLVLLAWEFCTEERHVLALFSAYVLGTLVPAGDTLRHFLGGTQTYYNRYASGSFDPNDLALTLALSLPMAYYLTLRQAGAVRWLYRAQMLMAIGTIFLTVSRGGTFCMLIALSLILWTFPAISVRNRITIAVMFGLAVAGAVTLVPATSWKRLASAASEVSEGTLNSRTVLWKAGLTEFQNVPFGGVGAGAYPETSAKVIGRPWGFVPVAHNSFISVLVETGLIGLALFAGILAALYRLAARMPRVTRAFWLTLLCVWTVGVLSLTWEYRKPTWLVFGLLAVHAVSLPANSVAGATVNRTPRFHAVEAYS